MSTIPSAPPSAISSPPDSLYADLASRLRATWHPDLPIGRWLAAEWDALRLLRDGHGQNWADIADRLNTLGVRRNRRLPLSGTWLQRRMFLTVLWRVHEDTCPEGMDPDAPRTKPDWFHEGPLLGGPRHSRRRRWSETVQTRR